MHMANNPRYPSDLKAEQLPTRPGEQHAMEQQPQTEAPHIHGSDKLLDKVAIITGADSGIGRAVAVLFAREGAKIAVVYLKEDKDAKETQRLVEAEGQE
jgi:hypothetical protein